MGKRELVALLSLSSWCLVIVVWLFLVVPWVCLQFVIVVFPDHTQLLFLCVGLCFGMHYFMSFLVLQSSRRGRERAGCFTFIVLRMYYFFKYSVALPHCAVGSSAVCDCGIT